MMEPSGYCSRISWPSIPVRFLCLTGLVLAIGSWLLEWIEIQVSIQKPALQTFVYSVNAIDSPVFMAAGASAIAVNMMGMLRAESLMTSKLLCGCLFLLGMWRELFHF